MADQITNYQCPACTGPLHFVGASGRLECDYCGSSYSVDEIEALYQRKDAQAAAETAAADEAAAAPDGDEGAWTAPEGGDWAEDGMQSYTCPSCGAELVCDASTAATSCPYCGNPSIVPGRLSGAQHYLVRRAGSVTFEKIPVDASSKMPDENMDSIEPFDYQALKPFSNAYLPGFLADQYDVSVEQSASRADTRCKASCESALRSTVTGYTTCTPETQTVRIRRGQVQYALLPVWMLHTKWKGKDYLFSMNGQTGKLTGDLPVSWGRFWAYFAGIAGGLAAVLSVLLFAL